VQRKQVWIGTVNSGELGIVWPFKVGFGFWRWGPNRGWEMAINIFRHRIYIRSGCNYERPIKTLTVMLAGVGIFLCHFLPSGWQGGDVSADARAH